MSIPIQRQLELFNAALEHTAGPDRDAFLAQACGNDSALRQCVEALLASHTGAGTFLAKPAGPVSPPGTQIVPITEKPGDRIGRYKLLQQIGEGGCGVVYLAEQEQPIRRRVALKVIRLGMDTKSVIARFEAERQALALMDHPNIAKVFDGGATESGRPYFVMELVRGIRITDYCDQAQLSTEERLKLFIQVCQAVQHAHQKGVIHRDIKPSNILVTVNDGVPVPKVIDFGIAKATDQRLTDKSFFTEFHAFIGTPAYTSPEQAEMSSLDIDTRSDIYSLGVLLYELLTGQTPFPAERLLQSGLDEMRRIIREEEPPKPSTRLTQERLPRRADSSPKSPIRNPQSAIDQDLDWIVMKALEKDRTRRYATSLDFAADLQRHLNNEPVHAGAPSNLYKLQKLIRRNKGAFGAAAAVFIALLTGLGLTAWQAVRASRAERIAQVAAQSERAQASQAREERDRAERHRSELDRSLYLLSMTQLQQAWERNNFALSTRLLKDTSASPERGFEWYFWQREAHRELLSLRGHRRFLRSAAYSPDGRRIATGGDAVRIWDATSGIELLNLSAHTNDVVSVAFSPDSRRLFSASKDRTARVWDAETGQGLFTLNTGSNHVSYAAFSPDGSRVVTTDQNGRATGWDLAAGKRLFVVIAHSIAFSPDGRRFVTCALDRFAKVWDATTGHELLTLRYHTDGVLSVAWSPDGKSIASGYADGTIKVWDSIEGKELQSFRGKSSWIGSLAFSPDSSRLAAGHGDDSVKIWDVSTGIPVLPLLGHSYGVGELAFSPDGRRLVSAGGGGAIKVWDTDERNHWTVFRGHTNPISSLEFSKDVQLRFWRSHFAAAFDRIKPLTFSPDGQRVAGRGRGLGTNRNLAYVCDAATGRELSVLRGHTSEVISAAFSPDGNRIVTGGGDDMIKVWNSGSGQELLSFRWASQYEIADAIFSPDGRRIAAANVDGTARVWDAATGRELFTLRGHRSPVDEIVFSPDGKQIVTAGEDDWATIWDAENGKELASLHGHTDMIQSVAFSPDSRRIVTAGHDETIKVWDAVTRRELLTLPRHLTGRILTAAFTPDGRRIAAGDDNGNIEIWEAATPEQVRRWQEAEDVPTPQ